MATASSSLIFSSIVLSRSKASAVALLTVVGTPEPGGGCCGQFFRQQYKRLCQHQRGILGVRHVFAVGHQVINPPVRIISISR